jgi:NADPH-dependent 2,4-dienoyl-CoA reductase/sulfur reductase-like enzyme
MKFLIIGADAAGMSAASRARRNQPEMDITVLEQTQDVSYSACGMPYNIAEPDREMDDLVVRPASVFREKQGIEVLNGHRAEALQTAERSVTGTTQAGQSFEFSYDRLLIATGARPVVPDRPGFDLPGVMVLKSLGDGRMIKAYIKQNPVSKAAIIGMGYVGLEMAEALRARGIEVDMVKPGPRLLPWMHTQLADVVQEQLQARGVRLHTGHDVRVIKADGRRLQVVCPELVLSVDMVLVAIGVRPNSELAAAAGIQTGPNHAIAVGPDLQTSDPAVYAAGDCADAFHVVTGQRTWIPLALRANRAGWAAADNVCGKMARLDGVAGTAVFKVFDLQVARTGLSFDESLKADFKPLEVSIQTRSRAHAHPGSSSIWVQLVGDQLSGRLLGAQMVGREGVAHRINAAAVALHSRMTVESFAQTDLSYAPPFGPVWDPLLTAANQLLKKM